MALRRIWLSVVGVCLLCACQPREQAHVDKSAAPRVENECFIARDDHKLPLRAWIPETRPEAIIIAIHGFNDYSNAFEIPGEYLSQRHVALFAFDQRGFGRTKDHGIWGGEENLLRDTVDVVTAVHMRYPEAPIYLLGESMGGAVVVSTLARYPMPMVKGAILSAPALWGKETMNDFYRATLWLAAHTFPGMTLSGSGLKIQATDNIEILRLMSKDPNIIKRTRIDAIYGIVRLMDTAYTSLPHVNVPLLLLYGANDQVIPKEPVRKAINAFQTPVKVSYYPSGYHMLLRDLKGELVLNDIVSWIKYPERPLPSGYDQEWEKRFTP